MKEIVECTLLNGGEEWVLNVERIKSESGRISCAITWELGELFKY